MTIIYKILPENLWLEALTTGQFLGAAIDLSDGFIHFSDVHQARETARRHFHGKHNLLLVACDGAALGQNLRWEPSRGGALFPHLYGPLDPALALWAKPLPWDGDSHVFPPDFTA